MNNVQVSFHHVPPSDAIDALIRERAARLERFFPRIINCRVTVEASRQGHGKGNVYRIRVDVTVPGAEIVAGRDPAGHHAHEDAYTAVRDAFDTMRRLLQDHTRKQRGEVKVHVAPPHGRVVRFFPQQGYGFIETGDGHEIYFHENSVLDGGFQRLEVGTEVRYEEEDGDEGPQASTVAIVKERGAESAA
jgi:ribosomal subunit interface protein